MPPPATIPGPHPDGSGFRNGAVAAAAAVALAYALGHLTWYLDTPLGRVPVLDERENIDLAVAIAKGTLPHEPFYRAQGYPLLLAGLLRLGIPLGGLFPAALLLGSALHAGCAAFVARIAGRFFGPRAALLGGILYALDPVLVHYATQALDAELGLLLFIASFDQLTLAVAAGGQKGKASWAASSLGWAAATAVRPNYLLGWPLVPALALGLKRKTAVFVAALAGLLVIAAGGFWQWEVSGSPRLLPWQGPYNLWASNRPGANGRYYVQKISLPPELARPNPARAESVILYLRANPDGPADIASMNAYWRSRFRSDVLGHPLLWAKLLARKAYALVNTWEQYNNKTFAFHKERSPWLRWNPINWGLIFLLGIAGWARLAVLSQRSAALFALAGAACALGVLLFFVSARFRLPLVALATPLAGGALASPGFWLGWNPVRKALLGLVLTAAGVAAFSRCGGVADPSTFVQDHVLLAHASFAVGDDVQALTEARAALAMRPDHPDARAIEEAAERELSQQRGSSEQFPHR